MARIEWGELLERNSEGLQRAVSTKEVEYNIYQSPYNTYNLEALCSLIQYTTHLNTQVGVTSYEVQNTEEFE